MQIEQTRDGGSNRKKMPRIEERQELQTKRNQERNQEREEY